VDKKLAVSLVSLLATAALMVMPTTAPAETPHYTSNGANIGAGPVTTVGWGALMMEGQKGPVGAFALCRDAIAGTAANPGGGSPATDKTPGNGLTQVFATFDCESEGVCPAGTEPGMMAESLPWANTLGISAGLIRQATTGIKIFITCSANGKVEGGAKYVTNPASICCKSWHPASKRGTSALHPGFFEFANYTAGELEVEGSAETVSAPVEGELKVLGFNEQELIGTKKDPA
jgi:hypothetical protein